MTASPGRGPGPADPSQGRPWLERVGLGAAAMLFAVLFAGMAVAAWSQGEVFLAAMAGIGAIMTVWAAAGTMRRS